MSAPVISAAGLTKRFGDFTAVDGIDFEVPPGESFGLLGPNGAGKSTTMRMIGAVSARSAGTCACSAWPPDTHGPEIRSRLGVVPQEDNLDPELRVRDNLHRLRPLLRHPARGVAVSGADALLKFAQLSKRDAEVVELSGGMERRLTIARALIADPLIMLLDEPTTGLDPQARHLIWLRLLRLKGGADRALLSTHCMDEAQRLCDRLVVVDKGPVIAEGSPVGPDPAVFDARGGGAALRSRP